jgi:hypothetical protein
MKWYAMVESQHSTRDPRARKTLLRKHLKGKISVDSHRENGNKEGDNVK